MEYRCPICHKTVKALFRQRPEETAFFPFCSQRCKLIDLGAWLDADYRVSSELQSQQPDEPPMTGPLRSNKECLKNIIKFVEIDQ